MRESLQVYYYIVVFLSMLYAFKKVGVNKASVLIIMIFWEGLFQYIDKNYLKGIHNLYKIVIVAYAVYITGDKFLLIKNKKELHLNLIFLGFSVSFWISYIINGGGIVTILSQYLYKYSLVFILFHYFKDIIYKWKKREYVKNVVLQVLFIQVALSVIKFIITLPDQIRIGYNIEAIVGSMSAGGAGLAVVLPIVSLIFYWIIKNGEFTKKDWLIALSFIMISIASGKRQPIILFPFFLYLLFTYVKKSISITPLLKYIPLILLMFFVGAKLNPTFNPENKIWGSFDPLFVRDYIMEYNFGTADIDEILLDPSRGKGRGAGLFNLTPKRLNLNTFEKVIFGNGLYSVATWEHGRFTGSKGGRNYGLYHRGLMGDAGLLLYGIGYLGTGLMILMGLIILSFIKNRRIFIILAIYFIYDFLLYYNQVVFANQSAIMVLAIVFLSKKNMLSAFKNKIRGGKL